MAEMNDVPWFHFWNPQSGLVGGMITGALLAIAILAGTGNG